MSAPRVTRMVAFTPSAVSSVAELPHPVRRRADHRVAGGGVERDQVDVRGERPCEGGELGRVLWTVVDPVDQGPLDRQPPPARRHVLGAGGGQLGQRVAPVDGDELVAQLVVGGVQRHRQVDRQRLAGEPADPGHEADRREGEVTGRQAHLVVQALDGRPDAVVVGERLPHPHEHHVGQPPRPRRPHGDRHLLDDLARREVPLEAGLAGGAELAGHGATRLRGHAHRHPVGVAHQDRLDARLVAQRPQSHFVVSPSSALRVDTSRNAGGRAAPSASRRAAGSSVISSGRCTRTCRPSHTWRARYAGSPGMSAASSSRVRS